MNIDWDQDCRVLRDNQSISIGLHREQLMTRDVYLFAIEDIYW